MTLISSDFYISIDLGSNSFRMLVADAIKTKYGYYLSPILNDRQPVALASGLTVDNYLNQESIQRAINAFHHFKKIIDLYINSSSKNIFIVATSTFRVAKNIDILIKEGEIILGAKINTISGLEEAQLIYQGTSHSAPYCNDNRLVIDIGGGSTEFIIGNHHKQILCDSVNIGCINITKKFFAQGEYNLDIFNQSIKYICSEVNLIVNQYLHIGFKQIIGSSGTARILAYIASQIDKGENEYILSLSGLLLIKQYLIDCKNQLNIRIKKIDTQRANILAGGLSIMLAVFKQFNIKHMHVCEGGVRFGLIYTNLDSMQNNDVRYISIDALKLKYQQVNIIKNEDKNNSLIYISNHLIKSFIHLNAEQINLLNWSLSIHDIGKYINTDDFHKHSAYIINNFNLNGFSLEQKNSLFNLVLGQKGGLSKIDYDFIKNNAEILLILRLSLIINKHNLRDLNLNIADNYSLKYDKYQYYFNCPPKFSSFFDEEKKIWAKIMIKLIIND